MNCLETMVPVMERKVAWAWSNEAACGKHWDGLQKRCPVNSHASKNEEEDESPIASSGPLTPAIVPIRKSSSWHEINM